MPSNRGSGAPSNINEGLNGIGAAVNAAMMAPDAGPYLQVLEQIQKIVLGTIHGGQKGPPKPQGGPPGQPPQGGGTNLNQLQGGPPSPPSAGGDGGPSQSGASADDMRRMAAQQSSMAS